MKTAARAKGLKTAARAKGMKAKARTVKPAARKTGTARPPTRKPSGDTSPRQGDSQDRREEDSAKAGNFQESRADRTAVKVATTKRRNPEKPRCGPPPLQGGARPATRRSAPRAAQRVETIPAIDVVAREKELARQHAVTAVGHALSLLETLARTGPVPLAVLADAAGCGKTAASELLATMRSRNFVIQDEDHGLWRLGARWAVLGSAASEQGALAATAMPFLAALGNATGENVYLRVREGMELETVAIYQTDPGLRVYTEVGKRMPLHAGSGRMLLAHAPEAVQTQVLAQRLQRYTPSTRTDPTWIAGDLHRIRTRGFLITDSEVVAGTVSVCAPVRDASGQVVAALLIGAPSLRMRPPRTAGPDAGRRRSRRQIVACAGLAQRATGAGDRTGRWNRRADRGVRRAGLAGHRTWRRDRPSALDFPLSRDR